MKGLLHKEKRSSSQQSWSPSPVVILVPKWQSCTHSPGPASYHRSTSFSYRHRYFSHWVWHLILLVNKCNGRIYHSTGLSRDSPIGSPVQRATPNKIFILKKKLFCLKTDDHKRWYNEKVHGCYNAVLYTRRHIYTHIHMHTHSSCLVHENKGNTDIFYMCNCHYNSICIWKTM